jgi:hypothetical protein
VERPGAIAGPLLGPPRFDPGAVGTRAASYGGDRPNVGRWPIAAGVGVALIGPTLAIAASEWWGTAGALTVLVAGGLALAMLVALAVRQREAWIQARAREEAVRRALVDVAGVTFRVPASWR